MPMRKLKNVLRSKPKNQTPNESLREIRHNIKTLGGRETARRMEIPESTLRRWDKQGRIPERGHSIDRAHEGIERIRQRRKPLPPTPPVEKPEGQNEIIHWAFSGGPRVKSKTDRAAQAVVSGGDVAERDYGDLGRVRAWAVNIAKSGSIEESEAKGEGYAKRFRDYYNQTGQDYLNEAFLSGVMYVLTEINAPAGLVGEDEELDDVTQRNSATTYTNDAFNCWGLILYCKSLPANLYWLRYVSTSKPGYEFDVYEIQVWVQKHS